MTAPHPGSIPGSFPFSLGGSLAGSSSAGGDTSDEPPRNFLLDANHDIVITDNLQMVRGIAAIAQDCLCALRAFATFDETTGEPTGEWFLDFEGVGLPWFRDVLIKNPSFPRIRELVRRKILSRPGIKAITSMRLVFDRPLRDLTIEFVASTDLGELVAAVDVIP